MTTGKEEGKLQREMIKSDQWYSTAITKTHEMMSSGKPDLRLMNCVYGQLDLELKHKTTGPAGLKTGLTPLQRITIEKMNYHGAPAVAAVWSDYHKMWFITLDEQEVLGELPTWRWVPPVVKRVMGPQMLFAATRKLLSERGYPSAEFLKVDW
jgi:hypothetical protein